MPNELDKILQRACPLVAVPLHGELEPMTTPGQRILVAENGVFAQFKRDWLDAVQRIGTLAEGFPLPYGRLEESVSVVGGGLPVALIEQFLGMARAALPNETGAVLVWSSRRAEIRLEQCATARSLPDRLNCYWPRLDEDEEVILDLHSHGHDPAGFTQRDDHDDTGFTLCGVLGNVNWDVPSAAFRLVANGCKLYPQLPWDRNVLPWREARRPCRAPVWP